MQSIHADNVNWKSTKRGVREAKIFSSFHGSDETRIDIVDVPAGSYIPPHRHSYRREFITILDSAGAQMQIGDRIFRPIAGQMFHREPEDLLAITNDSHHPFRYSVVRFGFEPTDIIWSNPEAEAAVPADEEPAEPEVSDAVEPEESGDEAEESSEEAAEEAEAADEPEKKADAEEAADEAGDAEESGDEAVAEEKVEESGGDDAESSGEAEDEAEAADESEEQADADDAEESGDEDESDEKADADDDEEESDSKKKSKKKKKK